MATFLELAQATRMISGMQGTGPTSVVNAQGADGVIVRFVKDAYVDIQNHREDWMWMEGSASFTTTNGKSTYSFLDIFLTTTPRFKKYCQGSFIITDASGKKSYLRYIDRDSLESLYLNDTTRSTPTIFSEDPSTGSIMLRPIPSGTFSISFRYQKGPEILTTDAQVPALPISFHSLIVYKAVEKMSIYLGSPEIYRGYAAETAKMLGQLMRSELPKKPRMRGRPFV